MTGRQPTTTKTHPRLTPDVWDSGPWPVFQSDQGEANMASKDKGGRSSKTPASRTAKEKRQAKREKKAANSKTGLTP